MIKNLLLVALRNLKRDKWYSLLNVLGLTIGITFSLFLIFYIKDELSFDKYNVKADRIYRIVTHDKEADKEMMKWAISPTPLGPTLKKDYPEVEEFVRFNGAGKVMCKNGDVRFYEDRVFFADSTIFKVFTHEFVQGNPATALTAPNSVVITESIGKKYFGNNNDLLGKSLQNENGTVYKVTGVVKDVPKNSHLTFSMLISMTSLPLDGSWDNFNLYTYVLLKPNASAANFEKKLSPLYSKYLAPVFEKFNIRIDFFVEPVTDIHLHSDYAFEPEEVGSISYIYIFSAVALFMLIIACINYMNLTTARSARRAKEIGIRKVTGSTKSQLVAQFLTESVLTAVIAMLLSVFLIALLLPVFNSLSGKFISFNALLQPATIAIVLGIVLFVGLMGGSYPAFYLAKFNPVGILKGSLSKGSSNAGLRRVLVVVQFSISMIMLICTWIVYNQLQYLRKIDTGFNKDQVVSMTVNANTDIRSKILAFKNQLRSSPQVAAVSTSENYPSGGNTNFLLFSVQSATGFSDQGVECYGIDENYFNTLGMQVKKGRNFSNPADTLRSVIVNETLAKHFGWTEPIGKLIKRPGDTSNFSFEVVGVVKDFNQKSLYNPIAPLILFYRPNSSIVQLKVAGKDIAGAMGNVEKLWKSNFPDLPFTYTFLDQDFNSQYAADQKRGKIFTTFSVLTILITCLGLLGLIAFTTQQRQKEISIRKIVGAGIFQIIPLVTTNFILLVGVSCLIAFPIAYLFMHKWLKVFTYNTGITIAPFILSALVVLFITMLTVIFHAVKAAVVSPVKSLRSE